MPCTCRADGYPKGLMHNPWCPLYTPPHCQECDPLRGSWIIRDLARTLLPEALERGVEQLVGEAAGLTGGERSHSLIRAALCRLALEHQARQKGKKHKHR